MELTIDASGLNPKQREALFSPEHEILLSGMSGGKSHVLRAGLVMYCLAHPETTVGLLHPRQDELARDHIEGRNGLKAMLAGHGDVARFVADGVRFTNGSRIVWAGADRPADLRQFSNASPSLVFVDDLHRISRDLFETLAQRSDAQRGRIIAAAPPLEIAGWVADRFSRLPQGRKLIEFSAADLPESLRELKAIPTIEQFMDGLGNPDLAQGSTFRASPYVGKVINVLQRWFYGEFMNLVILMPPQHCKTLLGVRVMASYIVKCRPYETVGIASYNAAIAINRNKVARDFYKASGGLLAIGEHKEQYWKTPYGGGAWATGFGGGAGNPMSWGLIDDPDENMKISKSLAYIQKKDEWREGIWWGRESKQASKRLSTLITATRWWSGDTTMRTITSMIEKGHRVHIMVLPALYHPKIGDHYRAIDSQLITVEPDFRTQIDEPLDPARFGEEYWAAQSKNRRTFAYRDQQSPEEAGGGITFSEMWPIDVPVDPAFAANAKRERDIYYKSVRGHDLAATEGGGDYTASVKLGELKANQRIVIRHASRGQFAPKGVLRYIAAWMLLDGSEVDIAFPDDPAAGGKQQTDRISRYLYDVVKRVTIPCENCKGEYCQKCGGEEVFRFKMPRITAIDTKGMPDAFQDFAVRAEPISELVEGRMDYVRANWSPRIVANIPWWWRAVELADGDWQEELRQIESLSRVIVADSEQWWVDYMRELHLYPDAIHDDWVAATSYGWQALSAPRTVYASD